MSKPTRPTVAYFSAEYAVADDMPIYAGGLGILAADMVFEAGSQNLDFYAIGMVYHQAFTGDDPDQRPMDERLTANGFGLVTGESGERLLATIHVADREVKLQAWKKSWDKTHLLLLDARVDENDERDKAISDHLYDRDLELQLAQEMCLGFGGVAFLEQMGVKPDVYHLNEGHTALAGLALVLRHLQEHPEETFEESLAAVRPRLVGTKHTILSGAGLTLGWEVVGRQLEPMLVQHEASLMDVKRLATKRTGEYSDTKLMIELARVSSGVSKIHVEAEKVKHPESALLPITNGIFCWRWRAQSWTGDPLTYDDERLWATHSENRRQLVAHVKDQTGRELDPERLTVVWARRMTQYKRPNLLVQDLERLGALVRNTKRPIQFVIAGKANPADEVGINLMNKVIEASRRPDLAGSFVYLPAYNPVTAKFLVRGADLWLNTPVRGNEACGTSGMKASLNGALQFSTSDGWFDEVDGGKLGWILPERASGSALYDLLEGEIAPMYYEQRDEWIKRMRANMKLIFTQFTASRMLDDYYQQLYDRPVRKDQKLARAK